MGPRARTVDDRRFFLWLAIAMALTNVAGFSMQLLAGRSSFGVPPLVHAHALLFFGWVTLFVTQTALASRGSMRLHRRLGWVSAGWAAAMVAMGLTITAVMVREGRAPFFFTPGYFLVMNSLGVLAFAALFAVAVAMRKRTDWHRRMMMVAMTAIMGPALGRLLPMPLMIPWAGLGVFAGMLLFPLAGIVHDLRRHGHVHRAWWVGLAALIALQSTIELAGASGVARALHGVVTRGQPSAAIDPLAYPPPPWLHHP
jgi:hypothetical protein